MASRRVDTLRRHLTHGTTDPIPSPNADNDFDPDETLRRYEYERDLRLRHRPEGNEQYQRLADLVATGDKCFANMLSDPWCQIKERMPKQDVVEVCIIGAGYGGLCAGARFVQQGVPSADIRLVDTAGDCGGTWYWNR